jgi:glycerate 2-kinase
MASLSRDELNALLRRSFDAAVAAADPMKIVAPHLPDVPPRGRTLVVGAGKAAASMAAAVEAVWPPEARLSGIVITRYGHGLPLQRIRCIEAGHPVPDQAGEHAAHEILEQVSGLSGDDQLIVLISGGGSSLLSLPADGIPIADLKALTQALLKSGAPITDMNIVRKHLSKIQGGRLALVSQAPVTALVISDVVGDDPSAIASGPCTADPSTYQDAVDVLRRWGVTAPESIGHHLQQGLLGRHVETPKPGDPRLSHTNTIVIATARASLLAAGAVFSQAGLRTVMLGDAVTGEARDVAQVMASWAREAALYPSSTEPLPVVLVSGGECTVTVKGSGRGGRCVEFLLAFAHACDQLGIADRVAGVAADTDGIDGVSPHAGGIFLPDTVNRARSRGISLRQLLDNNDGLGLFEPLQDVITTGATLTNVNDYRAIIVLP